MTCFTRCLCAHPRASSRARALAFFDGARACVNVGVCPGAQARLNPLERPSPRPAAAREAQRCLAAVAAQA
eukprot:8692278-Lingulodinium_polyedra.AAC.1